MHKKLSKLMKIKILILIIVSTLSLTAKSQKISPLTLEGTWKLQNKNIYERWDKLNETKLLGISYKLESNSIFISEYLEISILEDEITYKATVIGQNSGKTISFKLVSHNENNLTFENLEHDFPNKISYNIIDKDNIEIIVSGKDQKSFRLKMEKE